MPRLHGRSTLGRLAYDAFISYSHSADGLLATAIERGLQRLARPWNRLKAMSVFRDESDLQPNSHLWGSIIKHMDDSEWFIYLACPESAASTWVNREVAHWFETKGNEEIILVLTGGEMVWDEKAGDFTAGSTAIPDVLRGRFSDEPLWADLRWARDSEEDLSLRMSKFRAAIAYIASPIRGMAPEAIESEDLHQYRRARTLRRAAVVGLAILAVAATVAAIFAVNSSHRADRRTREAIGRQLALASLDLPPAKIDEALLLALAGAQLTGQSGGDPFQASRTLIGRYSRLQALLHTEPAAANGSTTTDTGLRTVRGLALSPDGSMTAAVTWRAGAPLSLLVWPPGQPNSPVVTTLPDSLRVGADLVTMGFVGDHLVVVAMPGFALVSAAIGGDAESPAITLAEQPPGKVVAADIVAGRAVIADATSARLIDLESGAVLAMVEVSAAVDVIADIGPTRSVITDGHKMVLLGNDGSTVATVATVATTSLPSDGDLISVAVGTTDEVAVLALARTADHNARLIGWRRTNNALAETLNGAVDPVVGVPNQTAISADGKHAVVVGTLGTEMVDIPSMKAIGTDPGGTGQLALDESATYAAVGGRRLTVWDMSTGERVIAVLQEASRLLWHGSCAEQIGCSLVTAGETVEVWIPRTGRQITLATETNTQAIAVSKSTDQVLTAGWGTTVALWSLQPQVDDSAAVDVSAPTATAAPLKVDTAKPIPLEARCRSATAVFSPHGGFSAAYDPATNAIAVCNTTTGERVGAGLASPEVRPITAIAVDDAGTILAGGGDGFLTVFRPTASHALTGTSVDVRFGGQHAFVRAVAWNDGVAAAGVAASNRAEVARAVVWDVAGAGTPTAFDLDFNDVAAISLLGEHSELLAVAELDTSDASTNVASTNVASTNADAAVVVQLWQTATRRRLGSGFGGLTGTEVTLTGDTNTISGTDGTGRTRRWSINIDPTSRLCGIVGRSLTRDEWNAALGGALRRYSFIPVCTP